MWSRSAAMAQDVLVATAHFRKGVGQFRQPLEGTVILDGLGEGFHFGGGSAKPVLLMRTRRSQKSQRSGVASALLR